MGCHSGPDAKPENDPIDFSTYDSTTIDRFVPVFLKGDPERSRFYQSVFNGEMPTSQKLHDKEIQFIKDWILACAPNSPVDTIPDNCDDGDDDDDGDCDFDDDCDDDDFDNDDF